MLSFLFAYFPPGPIGGTPEAFVLHFPGAIRGWGLIDFLGDVPTRDRVAPRRTAVLARDALTSGCSNR